MVLSFTIGISGLASHVDMVKLLDSVGTNNRYAPFAMAMLPVALTSFGYHHSASSMRAYYGEERKASLAIAGGTIIALVLYLLWIVSIFGNLPRAQFGPVIEQGGNVDALLTALDSVIDSDHVASAINTFSVAAIISSFIGVSLGLFDFLADFFHFDDTRHGRTQCWMVTFIPPLLLSLFFPSGFLIAIGYAGAVTALLACIIPALLAWKTRKKFPHDNGFKVPGGQVTLCLTITFGVFAAIFHFLSMMGLLPVFIV